MNFITNTSKVMLVLFDNYVEKDGLPTGLNKYKTKIEEGRRLRGNSSLQAPGFIFPQVDLQFQEVEFLRSSEGVPVLKDGYYSIESQRHLLKSERSVSEIFNYSSWESPTETANRHRTEFVYDPAYVDLATYERHPLGLRKYVYKEVFEFSHIPEETDFFVDNLYLFSKLRKDLYEFKVEPIRKQELVVNQVEKFELLADTSSLPISLEYTSVLDRIEPIDGKVYFTYYPTPEHQIFTLVDGTMTGWYATDNFNSSTDYCYTINEKEGIAKLNPLHSPSEVYCGYSTLPLVTYYLSNSQREYKGSEVHLGRIVEDIKQGSFLLCLENSKQDDLELNIQSEQGSLIGNQIQSFYYNQPYKKINIQVINKKNDEVVPSVEIKITNVNNIGKVKNLNIYTNEDGEASFYYKAPTLSQAFLWGDSVDSTSISNPTFQFLNTNFNEMYLFSVWKDDPLMGVHNATEEQVEWNKKNGRKVVVYEWSASIWNPVTNTQGAYSPVRPVDLDNDILSFSSLPYFDPDDVSEKIGGLVVAGELITELEIEYENKKDKLYILNKFLDQQKGSIEYLGKEYPMGFKLYSENLDVSNMLGGPTYLTINPYTSEYTILFESTSFTTISNNIDLQFNLIA